MLMGSTFQKRNGSKAFDILRSALPLSIRFIFIVEIALFDWSFICCLDYISALNPKDGATVFGHVPIFPYKKILWFKCAAMAHVVRLLMYLLSTLL